MATRIDRTAHEHASSLLQQYATTYAQDAGIRLTDRPGPLYQLLVLATLLSTRISAKVAVAAARELFAAGMKTPAAMRDASWEDRVHALGRGHYVRYDESTSTRLGNGAQLCLDRWGGDLRRMHAEAKGDRDRLRGFLTEFPGVGPTGADIFLREVQGVWPDLRPYVDTRMQDGARKAGLPDRDDEIGQLVPPEDLDHFAAALVKVAIGH
jgi:endonuclease III